MAKVVVYLRDQWPYIEYVPFPGRMDGAGRVVELSDAEMQNLSDAGIIYRRAVANLLEKWRDAGSAEKR